MKLNLIGRYARFVAYHPLIMVMIVLLITGLAVYASRNVTIGSMGYSDMLPDGIEAIDALTLVQEKFGGTESAMIAVEVDPRAPGPGEIRDVRDPAVIRYLFLLTEVAKRTDYVTDAVSAGSILAEMNGGVLPKDQRTIAELSAQNPLLSQYLSKDRSMALVSIKLTDDVDPDELVKDLSVALESVERPAGVTASLAGDLVAGPIVEAQIGPDMGRTSQISLIGIVLILYLIFRSVRYTLTPLATIGIGVLWAFGYLGLMGIGINSATSGVISMIMGIGIDFGIQIVTRFREELGKAGPEKAMETTLMNVLMPMATTTIAALIGFKAMAMGQLTIMGELGRIMSYGIAACFLVAITIVPALIVLIERWSARRNTGKEQLMKRTASAEVQP